MKKDLEMLKKTAEKVIALAESANSAIFDSFHLYNQSERERVEMIFAFPEWSEMELFVSELQKQKLGDLIQKIGMHSLKVTVTEPR